MEKPESSMPDSDASPEESHSPEAAGMSRQEVGEFASRVVAMVLFSQAALLSLTGLCLCVMLTVASLYRGWFDFSSVSNNLILVVPTLVTFSLAWWYWAKAPFVAKHMMDDTPGPVTHIPITVQDVMMVGFSVAGVFVLIDGVRDAITVIYQYRSYHSTTAGILYNSIAGTAVVQFLIGAWLVLGSNGIVKIIYKLRTAGDPTTRNENSDPSLADSQVTP